jgi:Rrf2 family iron-sulfur cluster assembly transcriptional regulator
LLRRLTTPEVAAVLSKTAKYALRAVAYLASRPDADGGLVPLQEIAEALDVPPNYLSKVTHRLGRAGILESVRGPGGGFRLGIPAGELVLARVTAPFDTTGGPLPCLLMDRPCNPDEPCVAHDRWKRIAAETRDFFDQTTVAELLEGADAGAFRI